MMVISKRLLPTLILLGLVSLRPTLAQAGDTGAQYFEAHNAQSQQQLAAETQSSFATAENASTDESVTDAHHPPVMQLFEASANSSGRQDSVVSDAGSKSDDQADYGAPEAKYVQNQSDYGSSNTSNAQSTDVVSDQAERRTFVAANDPAPSPQQAPSSQQSAQLSSELIDFCKNWQLADLTEFERLRTLAKSSGHTPEDSINYLMARQLFLENVMAVNFDLQTSISSVVQQTAATEELNATMVYHRDKAIRYNTYANFVAGGITGILSGSFDMAKLPEVNPNTLDIVEGAAQSGLSAWALKQLRSEYEAIQGVPNVLAALIFNTPDKPDFPDSVWTFLNSVPQNSQTGKTRREEMVSRWLAHKFCLIHGGHRSNHNKRARQISGTSTDTRLSIDVMEDRVAMLEDLRSTLMEMNVPLGTFVRYIRGL